MISSKNGFNLNIKWRFPDAGRYAFVFFALLVALLLIYGNSFDNSFHFDDMLNIVQNPNVHPDSLSWAELKKSFHGIHLDHDKIKRPFSYLTLAVNHYFSGKNVFSYHVVNFGIYLITAVFLFLLIHNTLQLPLIRHRYEKSAYAIALLAVFFWATHPIQLTAVTYIVQRMAALAGMFYVMAMYLYLKARTTPGPFKRVVFFGFCVIAALFAFASKENAAMLPVTLFLFDLFLIQEMSRENVKRAAWFAVIPILILAGLAAFYVDLSSFLSGYEGRPFTLAQRLMTEPRVVMLYVSLLVYPVSSRLMLIHDIPLSYSLVDPWTTLASILVIIAVLAAALYYSKKWPLIAFCVIFFFINHVIESSIIPLELVYEHRNYIPSMFFFVFVAVVMVRVIDYFSYRPPIQFLMAFGFCFLLAAQAHTTYERNQIWQNEIFLWSDNAQKAPDLSRVHTNLGKAYSDAGFPGEAVKHFKKALTKNRVMRKKGRIVLLYNAALASYREGDLEGALGFARKTLEIDPEREDALVLLSQLYLKKGMLQKAQNELEEMINDVSKVKRAALLNTYAMVMYHSGQMQQAIDLATLTLRKHPGYPRVFPLLAQAFKAQGEFDLAERYWQRYLKSQPESIEANLALNELYVVTGESEKLEQTLKRLICLLKGRNLCEIINLGDNEKDLLTPYRPDLSILRLGAKEVLAENANIFPECNSGKVVQ